MSDTMNVKAIDSELSAAGIEDEAGFDQKAQEIAQSSDIKKMIDELSADGKFSPQDKDKVGEEVADKAVEAMGGSLEGLDPDQKMAIAEFCEKCLDKDANAAADEAMAETESAT
jgi:hypothetical protein